MGLLQSCAAATPLYTLNTKKHKYKHNTKTKTQETQTQKLLNTAPELCSCNTTVHTEHKKTQIQTQLQTQYKNKITRNTNTKTAKHCSRVVQLQHHCTH